MSELQCRLPLGRHHYVGVKSKGWCQVWVLALPFLSWMVLDKLLKAQFSRLKKEDCWSLGNGCNNSALGMDATVQPWEWMQQWIGTKREEGEHCDHRKCWRSLQWGILGKISERRMLITFLKMSGFWILELVGVHIRKAHRIENLGTGVRPGFSNTTY